jgi:hydroxyacyl-ACP dehydratase HTD2-like protein with hotdog domain
MIDRAHIGFSTAPSAVTVDAWRVQLFCQAIGSTNAAHWNLEAARLAGFSACPVPPTFLKAVETDHFTSAAILQLIKVPMHSVLHAEQSFDYLEPVYVGDAIEIKRTIADIYDKREGLLSFIVVDTEFRRQDTKVCESRQTLVVRNMPRKDPNEQRDLS